MAENREDFDGRQEYASASDRSRNMWDAMHQGTVRYDQTGVPLLPGDKGYNTGLPMKWNKDRFPVLPDNPEYASAQLKRPGGNLIQKVIHNLVSKLK